MFGVLLVQQAILFGFAAMAFGLHPASGWWLLAVTVMCWSACVLLLGTAASSLVRTPAQLNAAGDVAAVITTILAGALVPSALLPAWLEHLGPLSPGYWAMRAYRATLSSVDPAGLVRALAMLAVFGAVGIAISVMVGRRQRA